MFYSTGFQGIMLMVMFALMSTQQLAFAATAAAAASLARDDALIMLDTRDMESFHDVVALVRSYGGDVPQAYPPSAFVVTLTPDVEWALRQHPTVGLVERGVLAPTAVVHFGSHVAPAAHIWNTVFGGVPDRIAMAASSAHVPQHAGPDFVLPPPEAHSVQSVPGAPTSAQTSEFMAGTIVYSVIFVESNGGVGSCAPADPQTENWDASRQATVLSKISEGLTFWTSRTNRPKPLTFVLDSLGTSPTSCEPISRGFTDFFERDKWIADVLTAQGYPATPGNHPAIARALVNDRRLALGADWGILIFVVDSLNDADGKFADGRSAAAHLNGPMQYLTYDNGDWGISRMHLVSLHETGHNFGALDEYAVSGCSTSDTWGYLNVANASCNNGGMTSDISVMGEGAELAHPLADVSTSARDAIGWRHPVGKIVDVIRTATVSLTPFTPDPTSDTTPTYLASAGNVPFPPGGCNTLKGICYRTPAPVTISTVKTAQWKLDNGSFTRNRLTPSDGMFDEETGEAYTFTPVSALSAGTHTFRTRSINNFGHTSPVKRDMLTIR